MGMIKTLIDNKVQLVDPPEMDHRKPIKPEGLSKNERRAGPKTTRNPEAQHDDATEIRELILLQTFIQFWLISKFRGILGETGWAMSPLANPVP